MAPDSNKASGSPPGLRVEDGGNLVVRVEAEEFGRKLVLGLEVDQMRLVGQAAFLSRIDTLTPLGVGSEYSCSRSGCCGGHLWVMGKAARACMA
jgi:hypothetical protein